MNATIRLMTEADLKVTYEWRNDPIVREMAMSEHEISWAEHEAMFKYNNSLRLMFELDGVASGTITVSRSEDNKEGVWAFHMAPEARGKGLSLTMLSLAIVYLKKEGYTKILSQVKKNNVKSYKLHYKLAFKFINIEDELADYYDFEKEL